MHIRTLGGWVGFCLQICAGAAMGIWPNQLWIAKLTFAVGSTLLIGSVLWWFFANYKIRGPIYKRQATVPKSPGEEIQPHPAPRARPLRPDYEAWDDVEVFQLWQAACLWADVEPLDIPDLGTKAGVAMEMMIGDAGNNGLAADLEGGHDWKFSKILRHNLIFYALKKKKRPLFLYPDERSGARI